MLNEGNKLKMYSWIFIAILGAESLFFVFILRDVFHVLNYVLSFSTGAISILLFFWIDDAKKRGVV